MPIELITASRPGAPAIAVPQTEADVDALRSRVSELASQRSSVNSQRGRLADQLHKALPGADRAGLEAHIAQLDARLMTIESDIGDLGRAISAAPSGLQQTSTSTAPPHPYGQPNADQVTAIAIVGTIFVLMPLSIAFARIALRRATRPAPPQLPPEVGDRLERMEQGIEAVALEIERIGEGQRFVTQLMSERARRPALPEGLSRES